MEKRRILFIDNDPHVLRGLERTLQCMRPVWDMTFLTDPQQALNVLANTHFDVVVSDINREGRQFLLEVMHRHPQVVRIILSSPPDQESLLEALMVSHQLLAKPCDADTLKGTVSRALALRQLLNGNTPLKALVSRLESLPSPPALYTKLVQELQSPDASVKSVAAIIAEDPAMTAKILQLVNSAFFGLRRPVSNLLFAVNLLGVDTIKSLVLFVQVLSQFDPDVFPPAYLESLWQHSTAVGALARHIAKAEGCSESLVDDAFAAGLLHDVGKLILATNLPNIYLKALELINQEDIRLVEAEHRLFGTAHGETGAYLLGLWGLPEPIVEAVAYHHHPRDSDTADFSALTVVHAANSLSHEFSLNPRLSTPDTLDQVYLKKLGLDQHVEQWRTLCQQFLESPKDH